MIFFSISFDVKSQVIVKDQMKAKVKVKFKVNKNIEYKTVVYVKSEARTIPSERVKDQDKDMSMLRDM